MMGQPGTEEAIELAHSNPGLKIGFHWHITDSRPMTMETWPWGVSPARAGFAVGFSRISRRQVLQELKIQWQAFEKSGLRCDFANSHHHLHIHPLLLRPFLNQVRLIEEGWVRLGEPRYFGRPDSRLAARFTSILKSVGLRGMNPPLSTDTLWGIDRTFLMCADEVLHVIQELPPGKHEFIFHPRSADGDQDTDCLVALEKSGISLSW